MATQSGTVKNVASATNKIKSPCFETIEIDGSATYTLSHTPVEPIQTIYLLNGDGTTGTNYASGTAASDTEFALAENVLTPPTGLANGDQLFVLYEYEAGEDGEGAVAITNSANNFPVGCKFIMEVLGADVCDQTNTRAA